MPADGVVQQAFDWVARQRAARDELIATVRRGDAGVVGLIGAEPPGDLVNATRVLVLLEAEPGASKVGTRRLLATIGIDEMATVGDLDDARRAALGAALAKERDE